MRYAATVVYVASVPSKRKAGMKNLLMRLWQDENGQDLVEYSFLMVFVALAATVGMNTIATAINTILTVTETKLTAT
jgi:Flp pilus assembly pilin Flp